MGIKEGYTHTCMQALCVWVFQRWAVGSISIDGPVQMLVYISMSRLWLFGTVPDRDVPLTGATVYLYQGQWELKALLAVGRHLPDPCLFCYRKLACPLSADFPGWNSRGTNVQSWPWRSFSDHYHLIPPDAAHFGAHAHAYYSHLGSEPKQQRSSIVTGVLSLETVPLWCLPHARGPQEMPKPSASGCCMDGKVKQMSDAAVAGWVLEMRRLCDAGSYIGFMVAGRCVFSPSRQVIRSGFQCQCHDHFLVVCNNWT